MALPPVTTGMLIVFGLILVALVLFVFEPVPNDVTAIGVLVALVVLEPWTAVDARSAIAGFASPATVTIIAMYILSKGVQDTGIVDRLGAAMAKWTKGSDRKLLGATVGSTGVSAGFINNTPVVAVFIPMISKLADDSGLSPSKLLMPLSFAAMMGGTLTLVGTSTNILASDLSARLLDHPLSMFEFTPLGVIVLLVGIAYLLTVGWWLTPARVKPGAELTDVFELGDQLVRFAVPEDSSAVGKTLEELAEGIHETEWDVDFLQIERNGEAFLAAGTDQRIEPGDRLTASVSEDQAGWVAEALGLRYLPRAEVDDADLADEEAPGTLVEAVITTESGFVGETVDETPLEEVFETTVLGVRRGSDVHNEDLGELTLEAGDTVLLQTTDQVAEHLEDEGDLVLSYEHGGEDADEPVVEAEPLSPRTPIALGVMVAVIGLAALDVLPIVISALGGVVAMIATGCVRPTEAYDAVGWNVIFLLAGVLPLGFAMQQTGGDAWIAGLLVQSAEVLPVLAVLGLFHILTGLLANIITPVASVVLMIPVAVDTALRIGSEPFTFLLAVMFAASAAFMTPIGYQTNLMVYGPGGYKFTDYLRVGAPLQLLLAGVTTVGLWLIWGI